MKLLGALATLTLTGLLLGSCAQTVPNLGTAGANQGCTPGTAQLNVGDGFQQIMCGCKEASAIVTSGSGPVTCTVAVGTSVFFYYQKGSALVHQIVPSQTTQQTFAASPPSDPSDTIALPVYVFQVKLPGSYGYVDAYDNSISGQIVAQP